MTDFGAAPDDLVDDTVAFQQALDANDGVWVPPGVYDISRPLELNDGQHLAMHCAAVLSAAVQIWRGDEHDWPGDAGVRAVLEAIGKTGITIEGGTVDGQDPLAPDARAFGLFIRGEASNIHVKGSTFRRFPGVGGGDGVYIGPERTQTHGAMPVNVTLENVSSLNNFRQGLSITGGSHIVVTGGSYSGTVGARPGAGIDLEPNRAAEELDPVPIRNVRIENALMENNGGSGLWIHGFAGASAPVENVQVVNNVFRNNLQVRDSGGALADGIWTKGSSIYIASNRIFVRRGDGGIVLGLAAGDTRIEKNHFIGVPEAAWAVTRQVEPGEPAAGTYCVGHNKYSGVWQAGHLAPDKGLVSVPCVD